MDLKKIELLAPAGDLEGVAIALKYGADAVYCGGPFMQLRAEKAGFSMDELAKAVEMAHTNEKKLYVTVNSFAYNDEIPKMAEYSRELKNIGVDAVIVSDIGAISEIKEKCPELDIHLSTQANCMNYKAAEIYYKLGVSRIVAARELSLQQLRRINEQKPQGLEIEAFVHGSMCMSYSGRCLLSAFFTGRSANRGGCAQSCRWNYALCEEKRPGEYYPIEENERGTTILSSKDLCCISFLDELAEAGICSFKIEGRMRTPYSIGTTVNAYRMVMDGKCTVEEARAELETSSHRPFSSGFYYGDPNQVATDNSGYVRDWLYVADALSASENGMLKIRTRNHFKVGDELYVLTPGSIAKPFTLEKITNSDGESILRSFVPMAELTINAPDGIQPGDLIRRREDTDELN